MDICTSVKPSATALAQIYDNDRRIVIESDWNSSTFPPDANVLMLTENDSEYPFGLSFAHACADLETWLLNAARKLSVSMHCQTVYSGSPLADAKPYHCIMFDCGKAYLADDMETKLAGDGDRALQILRRVKELD